MLGCCLVLAAVLCLVFTYCLMLGSFGFCWLWLLVISGVVLFVLFVFVVIVVC